MSEEPTECSLCGGALGASPSYAMPGNKDPHCWTCDAQKRIDAYREEQLLTTRLLRDVALAIIYIEQQAFDRLQPEFGAFYCKHQTTILEASNYSDMLHDALRRFEVRHWLPVLKPYYAASDVRGHRGKGKDFKALLWGSAGRVLLTLERKTTSFTMIFDETSDICRGGIQGCYGTFADLFLLINDATLHFPKLKPDSSVGIGL